MRARSLRQRARASAGLTFVEAAISLAVLGLLLSTAFAITVETSSFLRDSDDEVTVQTEADRAFQRIFEVLRKSGRVTLGGLTYPRVTGGGAELEFRVLADLDSNGFAFDAATGALEWDPAVYTLKVDAGGDFGVYDGGTKVYSLGRHIAGLRFETIAQDATLHLREVRITFEARKPTDKGFDAVHAVSASVHMRN
ncbi:MAG: hypothetical protein HY721_31445 [Planctomycetes bacterium]|nr:hypothetical protein [Planctomycetota bacterium]